MTVTFEGNTISLVGPGQTVTAELADVEFPPYRPWLELGRDGIAFDAAELRRSVDGRTDRDAGPGTTTAIRYDLTVLTSARPASRSAAPTGSEVGVNREFLLQALDAGDQLTLGLDGPIAPLAIRNPDRRRHVPLLMPVRLD